MRYALGLQILFDVQGTGQTRWTREEKENEEIVGHIPQAVKEWRRQFRPEQLEVRVEKQQ